MSEPQFSIRSAKAKALAHALADRTGMPVNKLVEQALEHYDDELRQRDNSHSIDTVWEIASEGRHRIPTGAVSDHADLYDDNGLPR